MSHVTIVIFTSFSIRAKLTTQYRRLLPASGTPLGYRASALLHSRLTFDFFRKSEEWLGLPWTTDLFNDGRWESLKAEGEHGMSVSRFNSFLF